MAVGTKCQGEPEMKLAQKFRSHAGPWSLCRPEYCWPSNDAENWTPRTEPINTFGNGQQRKYVAVQHDVEGRTAPQEKLPLTHAPADEH